MKSSGTTYLNDITSFLCGYVYVVVLCREAEQRLGNHTTVTILQNLSTHSWGMARNLSNWKLRNRPKPFTNNLDHYMASSASEQDDPNLALWLATRARRMEPSCPFGTTHCIPQAKFPQKPCNKSFIDQVCSVKMAGYWPCSFFASLWSCLDFVSVHKHAKKQPRSQGPLSTSRKYPSYGWSRVYACQLKPHRGWVLNLIWSTLRCYRR